MYLAHHTNRHFKGFLQEHTLSDIRTRFISRLFSGIIALIVMGAIFGIFLPQPSTAHASAALPATDSATHVPVLLLHGLEGFNQANCNNSSETFDRWGAFLQLNNAQFAGLHWGSDAAGHDLIHTLGYFSGDNACTDYLGTEATYTACQGYYSGNEQTNNEDIRHLACRFYWFVYDNYTSIGIPVNILAHSMGGIIAKWALSAYGTDPTHFPYPLLVYNVVTLSTPFQGVPYNFGPFTHISAGNACNYCLDGEQLENGSPQSIIGALNNFSSTEGYWTVIGSIGSYVGPAPCDLVNADQATVLQPGPSLASARSVDYTECIYHEEASPGASSIGSISYQDDASTYLDWQEEDCAPIGTCQLLEGRPHALAMALEALGVTRGPDAYPISPFPVYDVPGGGAFFTVWQSMGFAAGPLGAPTGSWYSITGGQKQDFQYGSIYWSASTGTYEVQGAIYNEYAYVWNGPNGVLGFPTSNEQGIASGRVSYFYGNLCGGRGPNNSGAAIYYSGTTNAHQVGGCIYNKYWNMGGPNSQLNFPTSDVTPITNGYVSYFYGVRCGGGATGPNNSGSAIYSSGSGTYFVQGCIYAAYQRLGAATTNLGYPLSDEIQLYNSGTQIGWASYFQGYRCSTTNPYGSGGAIFVPASNNTTSGGHDVKGCIFSAYERLGGPSSFLGFPVSDETEIHNSSGTRIGWASYFAGQYCGSGGPYGSGSAIYVPASNNTPSGGYEVHGCIYDKYQRMGGPNGLGFPITDEQNVYDNRGGVRGRENLFNGAGCNGTGSAILWSSNTGAHEVHGCIYNAYVGYGGPSSGLGLPVSDEYTNSAGNRESDFQGGNIIWSNGYAYINIYAGCGINPPPC